MKLTKTLTAIITTALALSVFAAVASASMAPVTSSKVPTVTSFKVTPNHLPDSGGVVTLVANVKKAATCTFAGDGTLTLHCASGKAAATVTVAPNRLSVPKVLNLTLVARNQYGTTKKRNVMLTEAATPVVPTTVASTTTTPLTTAAPAPSTQCTGPCKFTFPAVDFNGIMSIQLNAVTQGVPCPDNSDPYFDECDASASQQLDDVNISVCAGSQGSLDVSGVTGDLSLDLTNATQASKDSVTNDSSVPTAFGNYGAVAPGQCITGDVYFDVTSGAQWQSLNYAYRSADFQSQTVYVWTS